jgi:endonuclease/exonuclease/phosphatase family metal-dependent hydrolase
VLPWPSSRHWPERFIVCITVPRSNRAVGIAIVQGDLGSTDRFDWSRDPRADGSPLSVATFNLHAGVDGWGRPFDVVAACRTIDADVLVLQETWTPDNATGIAETVGSALGYTVFEHPLARGRLAAPHPKADRRWMQSFRGRRRDHALYLDREPSVDTAVELPRRYLDAIPGSWGIAVLSRLPLQSRGVVDLGRLEHDRARRLAIVVELDLDGVLLTVIGTHMSHITNGAPKQFLRLRRAIRQVAPTGPGILAGDMNLWGPPVAGLLPGWRRAIRRRTWPSWRPHSQVDHILIRGPLRVDDGEVFASMGSDHLPLKVRLSTAP